jgi:hypothetical protein
VDVLLAAAIRPPASVNGDWRVRLTVATLGAKPSTCRADASCAAPPFAALRLTERAEPPDGVTLSVPEGDVLLRTWRWLGTGPARAAGRGAHGEILLDGVPVGQPDPRQAASWRLWVKFTPEGAAK